MPYRSPAADILFSLRAVADFPALVEQRLMGDLDWDAVSSIVAEASRFATEEIAPLNRTGDLAGAAYENGLVTAAPGFAGVYRRWAEAGWNGVSAPAEFGGMGLPHLVNVACTEIWNGASMAFALCPLLTEGAVGALKAHGSRELADIYLPPMVSGRWTGTMNLTEPQAGSDLNAVRTRAERAEDGSYRLFGQKIFITYGEHDMAENIVHLVLARLPGAPAGTRGLSLFLAPKFLVNPDGSLGQRNDLRCAGIEHKLGIHGSPTCVMAYGDNEGAKAWLVGEENRGLAAMFVMMNAARLAVGTQGVAIGDRAYQQALAYARERRQGRSAKGGDGMAPIIERPDVQRMLMTMKANVHAARGICHLTGVSLDLAEYAATEAERMAAANRAALLTPIAKAFSTDIGDETTSIGVQVHGGMGFIEETGAAQHMRDSRIAAIYEGANGIHAIDLVQRKLPLANGETVRNEIAQIRQVASDVAGRGGAGFGATAERLAEASDALEELDAADARLARDRPEFGARRRVAISSPVRAHAWRGVPGQSRPRRRDAGEERQQDRAWPCRACSFFCRKTRDGRARSRARRRLGGHAARTLRSDPGGERMTQDTLTKDIEVAREGAVLSAAFARPQKKNAITGAMYEALIEAFDEAERDPEIGALVMSGRGAVFTAGNDIGDFLAVALHETGEFPAWRFVSKVAAFEKPLIAAIDGLAIGVGTTLCFHCDLVYATPEARFQMPFVNLGLVPEAGSSLLAPQRFGRARAAELLLLADPFGADRALDLGLINAILPQSELMAHAMQKAAALAAKPRAALLATRRLMRGDPETLKAQMAAEMHAFSAALKSPEAHAAFQAFLSAGRKS